MAAMPLQGPKRPSFLPEVNEDVREGLRRREPERLDSYDSARFREFHNFTCFSGLYCLW